MEKLSVKFSEHWFDQLPPEASNLKNLETLPEDVVMALKAEAQNIYDSEVRLYHHMQDRKQDKDYLWVKKILHTGTLSDKVSAHIMLIQDCPVYNLKSINTLIDMVTIKGKRECLLAMDALVDLFLSNLLPENRKLKEFNEQPINSLKSLSKDNPTLRKRMILLWIFEDMLKSSYKTFILNVNAVSKDSIDKTKQKSVDVMCRLLKERPEQERLLLENVVNKIGDPVPKIGSHTCYLLGRLLVGQQKMKSVVINEVERLLFRNNVSDRTKYYCLCFMNQIIFDHEEFDLANYLIKIYFCQFKLFVQKGEVDTKIMNALLTGVSRAYPYARLKENVVMEQLDAMFRLVHMVCFNISVQALMLIFQVLDSKDSLSDRFYCTLYRKLFDPAFGNSSRQASLLNLVYRAVKKDPASVRVKAFVKRLLQISLYSSPNLQCAILVLLSSISEMHPSIFNTAKSFQFDDDSDSDEHYEDVPDEDDINNVDKEKKTNGVKVKTESSWHHKQMKRRNKTHYDPNARNPLHAAADYSNFWEILYLKQSFHPSVSLFANQFSNSKAIKYTGDPLMDFTTARFLDRFVYRNPKKVSEIVNDLHTKVFGARKLKSMLKTEIPVTSNEYLQQKSEKVPAEERFIYEYLQKKASIKANKDDSDVESVCSEDFEELLDSVRPEDDALNFYEELGVSQARKKSKRKTNEDSDEGSIESDLDANMDLDDEEVDFDEEINKEFGNVEDDLNLDDDLCEDDFANLDGNQGPKKSKKKRKRESANDGAFSDGDDFSALLEDSTSGKVDTITGQAFVNRDKAEAKQIEWEVKRDQYVKGVNWRKKKNYRKNKNKKFKK